MTMQGEPAPQPAPVPQAPAQRPGGLTALAVLNFVFAGLQIFVIIGAVAFLSMADTAIKSVSSGQASLTNVPGAGTVYLYVALSIVCAALLLASGVGYLGMKKGMGYIGGCAYGAVSIVASIIWVIATTFGFGTIIGLVYPILTLILLNTTFKKCFVN